MSTPSPAPVRKSHRSFAALAWLIVLVALIAGGWFGWRAWQAQQLRERNAVAQSAQRDSELEARVTALRAEQRAQVQRLQQAEATNRVLRDELLGLGQRAALIEDSVSKLADPNRSGAQALRLDEVEMVLTLAEQRLQLAGDLDGARHGYALAAGLLEGIHDPAYLSLRQTLAQERAALDALGRDPRAIAAERVQAFAVALPSLPTQTDAVEDARLPWWRRALSRIVQVRPADTSAVIDSGERNAGLDALQLDLTLAQAAAERRDRDGYRAALARADGWLQRLWPTSKTRDELRAQLKQLQALPLAIDVPTLGSTRAQLRGLRAAR